MSTLLRLVAAGTLLGITATQSGCLIAAAAAGTGATVAYVRGDLENTVSAPPDKVAAAAEAAMKDLDVVIVSSQATKLDSKVTGRTARDTRLIVDARAQAGGTSKISIRAGTFGDNALQSQLMESIRKHLGESAAAPSTQPSIADSK